MHPLPSHPSTGRSDTNEALEGGPQDQSTNSHGAPPGAPPGAKSFSRGSALRGSLRKMLPPVPDMDTQISLSAKMIDKRTSTPKGNHSYGPFFLEYSLLAEFNLLQKQRLPGLYVIPSHGSSLVWFGIIFIRQGIYQEGVFRFKVLIPENFPDGDCPKIMFDHSVFHPAVDPETNELNLKNTFPKWKRNIHHIWQILLYIRKVFYKIDPQEMKNVEACSLFVKDRNQFKDKVRACVLEWETRLYEVPETRDPHFLTFSPYNPEIHDSVRRQLASNHSEFSSLPVQDPYLDPNHGGDVSRARSNGFSFLDKGSLTVFSKNSL
ncbi:hypothetical protein TCAL_00126 [Tigriopus californicus]|uniref:UBC core domain-containing protein n=2 Tax=Tigriopus californicus TaxID=6832 RepID=A0A553PHT5_TIGCA|nr:hypothetical protein TCAL_00126 [Tigriopus californicus]|eukprot:TCALIF_00126-PA protein Name:"Similar to Aktip AKT-interacting protein (Rattus norvegicus)" AED:0.08 eAED:0.08 QI:124/1/1/1/1/1/5/132/320